MRVLFSCFPGYGHLLPLIPLARACQRAGHEVLVATGQDLCPEVERLGFAAASAGLSLADTVTRNQAASPGESALANFTHLFVEVAGRARAAELVPLARRWSPDLIVHDDCEPAAIIAASLSGAARVAHGLGIPVPQDVAAAATSALERLFTDWDLDRAAASTVWDVPYLDIYPRSLRPDMAFAPTHLRPLCPGAVKPPAGARLPNRADHLAYERTIYVTLGTLFNENLGLFAAVLAGLRDEPVNLIVTLGPNGDPARLGPQPTSVVIERFLPQALVLPRCDAVIAHGGAGTMLAALAHGLPLVLLPQGADQFVNAAACAGAGAGIALPPGEGSPAAIAAATRRVLGEPGHRERARQLAAEIAAMPAADAVLADLEREVRPIAHRH
jgi:UDP:flavonoid glycosyltransferase YjiC (YdhE family)